MEALRALRPKEAQWKAAAPGQRNQGEYGSARPELKGEGAYRCCGALTAAEPQAAQPVIKPRISIAAAHQVDGWAPSWAGMSGSNPVAARRDDGGAYCLSIRVQRQRMGGLLSSLQGSAPGGPDVWQADGLRRRREVSSNTSRKHGWPVSIWHRLVHQGAVAEAVHVALQTTLEGAPSDVCHAIARHCPTLEALEVQPETLSVLWSDQVHECITKVDPSDKLNGQVYEVIPPVEPLGLEQIQQHVSRVLERQVPEHD